MRRGFLILLAIAGLSLIGTSAARAERDVLGWEEVRWGMPIEEAIALFERVDVIQQTQMEIAGCFVRYAAPIRLWDEDWAVWLCEAHDAPVVIGVRIESYSGRSKHMDRFVEEFTASYGPAHLYWHTCHNTRWNGTIQYTWYFPSTRITLVDRDVGIGWVGVRYEQASDRPEFGPGVCPVPPIDLRVEDDPNAD